MNEITSQLHLHPQAMKLLDRVFQATWKALVDSRDPRVLNATFTRDIVAKRMMDSG